MKKILIFIIGISFLICGCASSNISESLNNSIGETKKSYIPSTILKDVAYYKPTYQYNGNGDKTVSDVKITEYSYLKSEDNGNGPFNITSYNSNYDIDLLTSKRTLLLPDKTYKFKITSSGDWNLDIYKVGTSSTDKFSGNNDFVTPVCISTSNTYRITANTTGYFSVKGYYGNGEYKLLVNTSSSSGKISETVYLNHRDDYVLFVIECGNGNWKIDPIYD